MQHDQPHAIQYALQCTRSTISVAGRRKSTICQDLVSTIGISPYLLRQAVAKGSSSVAVWNVAMSIRRQALRLRAVYPVRFRSERDVLIAFVDYSEAHSSIVTRIASHRWQYPRNQPD